ncbi:uncharacterized protein LOC128555940 [Mercenaria mercenaria]|uniref:uncharacterized protein LOC128555940 n=1 Tax=Mercenaria mercenaria TaxID=6596 RepID=UPI00234EDDDA|nr:uncharacterized protein LOC128555940 [Mercenaria mercenaria]
MERKRVSFNVKTATCGICRQQNLDADDTPAREAVVFCKTCAEFLCASCLKPHRKLVVTENHQLLNRDHVIIEEDKNDGARRVNGQFNIGILSSDAIKGYEVYRAKLIASMSKDPFSVEAEDATSTVTADDIQSADENSDDEVPVYNFTEYCSQHSEGLIKYYCEHHSQLCCELCKQNEHKICFSKLKFIPEVDFDSLTPPFRKIDAQIADFKEYDRKLQCDLKELKKSRETFLHDLKIKKRELLNWLNLMEVRAVRRLEIVFDKCKRDIEKKRQKAKHACEDLRAEVYFLKEILRSDMHDNIYKYIKMKQADKSVNEALKKKEHRQFTNTRFCLKINDDFQSAQRDAGQLYEMNFEKKDETKYNIRLKEEKRTCNITGCAMLPTGGIALADRNNANIKVFNSQFKLTAKLNVPDGLFDLTCISQNALAVTSPLKSKINIAEIRPEPEIVKIIETGTGTCWGVKHHEGIFVVNCSTKDSSFIRAVDLDSNILFQVETKCNFYSEIAVDELTKHFTISTVTSCYIDGSDTKIKNYVDEHEVAVSESQQTTVLEYNYFNHLRTKGVTFDSHSNIVVCCKDTDQIYTIAHAGNDVELLLAEADGLCAPQALCYNDNKSKLLVTSENTDFIQIFEFAS